METPDVNDLPNLHDAQLFSMEVNWTEKILRFRLKHGWPSVRSELVLSGLRKLSMTTLDEWGPSVYVLGIKTAPHGADLHFLIEMQSGDVIEAVAVSFEFVTVLTAAVTVRDT
jgi:hypothetical protein